MSLGFHELQNCQETDLSSCRLQSEWSRVESGYCTQNRLLGNHGNIEEVLQLPQAGVAICRGVSLQAGQETAVATVGAAAAQA